MAKIFITGSADGLGHLAANHLVHEGHQVVLHARNETRAAEALTKIPGARHVLVADLNIPEEVKRLAFDANALGTFDAVIHNAGVYQVAGDIIFRVNTLAPYILTCMINKPERLVYLSSGLHMQGNAHLSGFNKGSVSYSDSKLHMVLLPKILSRRWHGVYANAVDPGWVPTRMGGAGAPGSLQKGIETQSWLAISNDREALVSGRYFYNKKVKHHHPQADDTDVQDRFLELCEKVTGVKLED